MSKLILILGGARSGKSNYAISLAKKHRKVAFVATSQALDKEMKKRILIHQKNRPKNWKTYEEPWNLAPLVAKISNIYDCVVIDCLTLLVSNLILKKYSEKKVIKKIDAILAGLKNKKAKVIMVSNEVGLGLVPTNKLGRNFRDLAGKINQTVAKEADEVFFTICGIPVRIKGEK
ncbi:MAG: bifunctional adenosylcobinamide kinase/adenosylcobinamide-phosphate guanylyltransferase [Candidatus Omnitrophota bacterium]|nr:bifunctional adenosylcobinamide kinase/adenosylcobinamide-phosphate guanylyltransferase [Candidatus Omnitrophota bacterium]